MQANLFSRRMFVPLPTQRELHFWYILPDEVQKPSLLDQYMELLSPFEKENISRVNGEKLRKGALLARTLVRTTLSRYTNFKVSPRSLKFRKNRFGKPEVDWQADEYWSPPSLHFNLSHSPSLIACGVALGMPIGIDIEEKHRQFKNDILSFARRYFTTHEFEFLHALPDPEIQRQELIKIWTLKEAYVKALGRGFSAAPFRDFTIRYESHENKCDARHGCSDVARPNIVIKPLANSEFLTSNWQLALFELASSHYAAVCCMHENGDEGSERASPALKVWKTIPFVEDEYVSGTDAVEGIGGFSRT